MGSMKVHQFARGFWEHEPSLTLGCKRLRPLAPKVVATADTTSTTTTITVAPFDLKSFIRPESGPRKLGSNDDKREPPPVSNVKLISSPPKLLYILLHAWKMYYVNICID